MSQSLAIGIDLGTTFSCVGVFQYGIVEIIANDLGNRTTPSYVAFTDECRLTGDAAKSQLVENFENTVYDVKRLIGRRFNEFSVQEDAKNLHYKIINKNGKPFIKVKFRNEIKHFQPEEISAFVLTKMKKIAEDYLGTEITDAVITVPAYFNDSQRRATKDAGAIAGLNVLRIINEPTAAAIAYGLDTRTTEGEKNVLVFDLGGGTLDVTILSICDGIFEVKSTSGAHLGGWDFDCRMVNYFLKEFQNEYQKKISYDRKALCHLRVACETAKLELSIAVEATINIVNLFENIDFISTITRVKFEELCNDLFESTLVQVERALEDARFTKYELDEIVLVDGSTRIPKIQRLLKIFFDGKELNISIDPDTAIAYGAAVQAAILTGNKENFQDLLLLDVTPLSLGVKTEGGIMTPLIKRNTTIPITEAKIFSTARDNQKSVLIEVFEGERALVRDNQRLGRFELIGFTPAPRLVPQIEVTFSIDANGILVVSAVERKSGKEQQISIKNNRSQSDIDQMISDGERHREQDEKYRQNNLARKQLLNLISQIELTLNQPTLSISSTDKNSIESIISEISNWLRSNENVEKHDIESRKNRLQSVCMSIIEKTKNMVDTTMNQLTESNENESEPDKHFKPMIEELN